MQHREAYFDERLFERGIDYVAWDGVGHGDEGQRIIVLRFIDDTHQGEEIEQTLIGNAERTEYHSVIVNDDLTERGIVSIRVEVFRDAPIHSEIYILVEGNPDPLRVTKLY
jgi:hypothetical protein